MNEYVFDGMSSGMHPEAFLLPVIIVAIISFIISVLYIVSTIKIYTKAGKPWWAAIVPIYNIIVLMDIAKLSYKNLLFILIPIVGIVIFMIKLYLNLAKRFNKGTGFAVGLILMPIIFIPLLAFSKDDNIKTENVVEDSQFISQTSVENNIELNDSNNIQAIGNISIEDSNNVINELNNDNYNSFNTLDMNVNNNQDSNIELLEDNISSNFEQIDINKISNSNTLDEINSFNSAPVFETVSNTIQEDNSLEIETFDINTEQSIVDDKDSQVIETFELENDNPPIEKSTFNYVNNNVNSPNSGKNCKNCGTEMPKIVTICPVCGTDNE